MAFIDVTVFKYTTAAMQAQLDALEVLTSRDGGMYGNTITTFLDRATGLLYECPSYHSSGFTRSVTYHFSMAYPVSWSSLSSYKGPILCEADWRDQQWASQVTVIRNEQNYLKRVREQYANGDYNDRERFAGHIKARIEGQNKRINEFHTHAGFM